MEIIAELKQPYTEEEREDFIVEYNHRQGYKIEEADNALLAWGYTEEEKAEQRQANFERQFILTSKGNYRLQPKGYANAQQSIDTVNAIVMAMQGLTEDIANMVIFYDTPDFSKPEECTEEWLVQHQHHPQPMTVQEWVQFYIEFTTLYAQKQYKVSLQK